MTPSFAILARQAQTRAERFEQRHTAFLVSSVARPLRARCRALAEIVHQRGEPNFGFGTQQSGLVEHHQGMQSGIDLRVPPRGLRHAEQRVDLRIYRLQRAALAQHPEELARFGFTQGLLGLLPYPLGHQRVDLVPLHHGAHQSQRFGGHPKAQAAQSVRRSAPHAARARGLR